MNLIVVLIIVVGALIPTSVNAPIVSIMICTIMILTGDGERIMIQSIDDDNDNNNTPIARSHTCSYGSAAPARILYTSCQNRKGNTEGASPGSHPTCLPI